MIEGIINLQFEQIFSWINVRIIAPDARGFRDKGVLVHRLAVSFSPKNKGLVVFQSESDKRERSISTRCFEVVGNEGEGEEGVRIHFNPWTTWVEVVIHGVGFLDGERTQ